jgi:hypothetical protein
MACAPFVIQKLGEQFVDLSVVDFLRRLGWYMGRGDGLNFWQTTGSFQKVNRADARQF